VLSSVCFHPNENGIFSIPGHAVTLTFDHLTPKPNQLIFVQDVLRTKVGENPLTCIIDIAETPWTDAYRKGQHKNNASGTI